MPSPESIIASSKKSKSENPISDLRTHLSNLDLDSTFSLGGIVGGLDGKATAERTGDRIIVTAQPTFELNDQYEFHRLLKEDAKQLENAGRARQFQVRMNWRQEMRAIYRIERDAAGQEHVKLEDIRWTDIDD